MPRVDERRKKDACAATSRSAATSIFVFYEAPLHYVRIAYAGVASVTPDVFAAF